MSATAQLGQQALSRARRGTIAIFVLLGAIQGSLASRMPALKTQAGLSDGLLGLALLGIPLGSLLAVQVTGRWISRRGSSTVTIISSLIMSIAIIAPAVTAGFATLTVSLVLVGIGIGLTDAAMNAHAVTVEKAYRRRIMSSFHGFASLGNLTGALAGALAVHLGWGVPIQFGIVAAAGLTITGYLRTSLLPGSADAHPTDTDAGIPAPRTPWSLALALLAGIALLSWMTEHAVADWSAVYLRDQLDTSASAATYGYAVFAGCMIITRFSADRLTAHLGPRKMLLGGGLIAGAGLAAGLAGGTPLGFILGCGLVGIGMAGVVPIVFTTAGNLPGVSAGSAVSKVAGVAFAGSLIGPPLIGVVAELTTLQAALYLVAGSALLIAILGPTATNDRIRRLK